jgi:hypothetical protein
MFLKLFSILSLWTANPADTVITEADMIGKWNIKYCYEKAQQSCIDCKTEEGDFVYDFKKAVFSEVMQNEEKLVQDRRYGSWSLKDNVLVENTTQNLNGKIVNYVHEYKLTKINKDKYFVSTIEGGTPLYIYYCRLR